MILVTGAAGKTGTAVTAALAERGAAVRAFVHREAQIETVTRAGAVETSVGDMRDTTAVGRAVAGVRAIYHICPNMSAYEIEIGRVCIEAARRAGVERFVYHSVLYPQTEAMPHHWYKLRVEEKLLTAGIPFTILQPCAYMQNILGGWERIVQAGVYAVPYPVETRLSLVDLDDVAEAAAIVLTEVGHEGAAYQLVGTGPLAQTDVAAGLATVLGRPVRAQAIALTQWRRDAQAAGLSPYAVETLVAMFQYYARYGFWGSPQTLTWLLGRAPTSLEGFVRKARAITE